ncbi:hypothetical protein H8N03_20485 [Ramlibacter sp. USB13]|uniref:Uncharacterized protein n=1 Tax=Ramlibacter cellulosilyticus TaxID=2764187 RepID=A0A923SGX1_9BURK|nr:hypothetical protein [Ramlibacter cellulosilyticus]MBC5785337.1 hypothetical protein [Ramlibacter cellulosilyticus]
MTSNRASPAWHLRLPANSAWRGMLGAGAAFALFAATQVLWPAAGAPAAEAPMALQPPLTAAPERVRCQMCGVVEAIDRMEATDLRPAAWVFTVRLPDGSLRQSHDALRGRWQVGDGMQLIGGDRTWNLPTEPAAP